MCLAPSGSSDGKIEMLQLLLWKLLWQNRIQKKMWYTVIPDIVLTCELKVDIENFPSQETLA